MNTNQTAHSVSNSNTATLPNTLTHKTARPWARLWPTLVILTIGLLLIGLYQFTIHQFTAHVATDHAEHGRTSPHVHSIVHVRQNLVVGVNPNNEPFTFKPSGELVGFDIDLAKAIAREMNVPVEFVEYDFDSVLTPEELGETNPLIEDKVDLVISGVNVNRLRQEYYAFSSPYLTAGLVAITPTGSSLVNQSSDIPGKLLGVIKDSSAVEYAKTVTLAEKIIAYSDFKSAEDALLQGSIEAILLSAPSAQTIVSKNSSLHIATDFLTTDDYAVMTMRDEDDLVAELNSILTELRQKGVLESLRHKWLE